MLAIQTSPPSDCATKWGCVSRRAGRDCPLHDPDPDKDCKVFYAELIQVVNTAKINRRPIELDGVTFPSGSMDKFRNALELNDVGLKCNHTTFYCDAWFKNVTFGGVSEFRGAKFLKEANFSLAKFEGYASFEAASFKEEAKFLNAVFGGDVIFDAIRCPKIDFTLADFKGSGRFRGTPTRLLFADSEQVVFDEAKFLLPEGIRFAHVDFNRCSLLKTDLRKIDFSGVVWSQAGQSLWKRHCLFTKQPEKQVRTELETAYRQIRQSYEDRRNYPEAGDFYYGEMEQKRKRTWSPLTILYWLSSGYGQRPVQAFLVLLALLICFTWLFLLTGIEVAENSPYTLTSEFWNVLFLYTLRVVTFSTAHFTPLTTFGEGITTLWRIFFPVQAALFFLAVNRKFKR